MVDFFLCKRGGVARKEEFSAKEKKAWRKIWCGFFFDYGCNGHGARSLGLCCDGGYCLLCLACGGCLCNDHSSYRVDRVPIDFHEYICMDT